MILLAWAPVDAELFLAFSVSCVQKWRSEDLCGSSASAWSDYPNTTPCLSFDVSTKPKFPFREEFALDTIAVSSFINFPGRLHLNEGEASNSSMLREAPSFVFAWITHFVSRFWLGLFILAKILIWGQYQIGTPLFFHFRLKKCKWSYLHDFETNKWTLCLWFSTVLARISIWKSKIMGSHIFIWAST